MIEVFELRDKMAFFDEAVQMYWDQLSHHGLPL